jgi:hypothetical protein
MRLRRIDQYDNCPEHQRYSLRVSFALGAPSVS